MSTDSTFKALMAQAASQQANGLIGVSSSTKKDPPVFMGTTPGRLPSDAGVFDQFNSTPKLLRDNKPTPNQAGTKYVQGPGGEMMTVPIVTTPPPTKGTPPKDNILLSSAALNVPLSWGKKKIDQAIKRAQALGYKVNTFADFLQVWQQATKQAAAAFDNGQGKKISPWDMMEMLATGATPYTGPKVPFSGTRTETSTNTSVDDVDPGAAASIIDSALTQYLGRAATDQEKADFLSRANGLAKANPSVTKSTTDTTYKNDEAVGSNTTQQTSGGITQDDLLQSAEQRAKQNPDYGAYQAASTIMGWLNQAVAAPV